MDKESKSSKTVKSEKQKHAFRSIWDTWWHLQNGDVSGYIRRHLCEALKRAIVCCPWKRALRHCGRNKVCQGRKQHWQKRNHVHKRSHYCVSCVLHVVFVFSRLWGVYQNDWRKQRPGEIKKIRCQWDSTKVSGACAKPKWIESGSWRSQGSWNCWWQKWTMLFYEHVVSSIKARSKYSAATELYEINVKNTNSRSLKVFWTKRQGFRIRDWEQQKRRKKQSKTLLPKESIQQTKMADCFLGLNSNALCFFAHSPSVVNTFSYILGSVGRWLFRIL